MFSTGDDQHAASFLKGTSSASYLPLLRLARSLTGASSAGIIALSKQALPLEIAYVGAPLTDTLDNFPFAELSATPSSQTFQVSQGLTVAGISIGSAHRHMRTATSLFLLVAGETAELSGQKTLDALEDLASLTRNPIYNTGSVLPNRMQSMESVQWYIEQTATLTRRAKFGLIRFNLDHLSFINERYGWDVADIILEEIIRRIEKLLPQGAFLGGMGGGNFIVLTPPGYTQVTTRSLMTSILRISETPVALANSSLPFSLSVGWGMFPEDGNTVDDLLTSAKAALMEAQRLGGGHERRADEETTRMHILSSSLEQDLAVAVEQNGLFLNWMPVVDTASQQIVAHEALLRWTRPGYGEVPPALFIRCAEEAGLVEMLDSWSLRTACMAAAKWDVPHRVCVNISPVWLVSERLSKLVKEILQESGLAPERLQIEMSEPRFFGPEDITFRELSRVRALGVRLALDDFGSGFSSLERLRFYPLDQIKLDRRFINSLGENNRANEVMCAILALARALNITTCAKGVETESQMAFLDAYGCEEVQGYLLGSPVGDQAKPASQST